jgi:hypothetical protein
MNIAADERENHARFTSAIEMAEPLKALSGLDDSGLPRGSITRVNGPLG